MYNYHPDSESLHSRHFNSNETMNGYNDPFSSDPNAPRPYSHTKNAILRHQHRQVLNIKLLIVKNILNINLNQFFTT